MPHATTVKPFFWGAAFCLFGLISAGPGFAAEDVGQNYRTQTELGSSETSPIVFIPPAAGTPSDTLGAGTRTGRQTGTLRLLAPQQGGVTSHPKPLLLWHTSQRIPGRVSLSIKELGTGRQVVETTLGGPFDPGFYAVALSKVSVTLSPGAVYQWELTEAGSTKSTASALLEFRNVGFIPISVEHAAETGMWYDAVSLFFRMDQSGRAFPTDAPALLNFAQSAGLNLESALRKN